MTPRTVRSAADEPDIPPGETGTLTETTKDLQEPVEEVRVWEVAEVTSPGAVGLEEEELQELEAPGPVLMEEEELVVEAVEVKECLDVIIASTGTPDTEFDRATASTGSARSTRRSSRTGRRRRTPADRRRRLRGGEEVRLRLRDPGDSSLRSCPARARERTARL